MKRHPIAVAVAAIAALAFTAADPAAAARVKPKAKANVACADVPKTFSWDFLTSTSAPRPNGCAPAVFTNGHFVGQDPDPYIRSQLLRDPATGYRNDF